MRRPVLPLAPVLALSLAAVLAGCSTTPPPGEPAPPPPAEAPVPDMALTGDWWVAAAWPLDGETAPADHRLGQRVRLGPDVLIDPLGRTCPTPRLVLGQATAATVLGGASPEFPPGSVTVVTALCGNALAGHYVITGPALLTRSAGTLLRLERRAPAAMPAPAPSAMADDGAVYLASYSNRDNAVAGWKKFVRAAPALAAAAPRVTRVELPGRGPFFRLFATGVPAARQAALCRAVRQLSPDCGATYR